jgi:signal transduction histidine kinase
MKSSRDPRLIVRFGLASLVAFVTVGVVLAFLVSNQLRGRQEQAAKDHAVFVTDSFLRYELTAGDVSGPIDTTSRRYLELLSLIRSRLLQPPVVRVKIWRSDGTIVFSDEPRLIGQRFEDEAGELQKVFDGEVSAGVSDLSASENIFERGPFAKLFETHVPLYLPGTTGDQADAVAELYTDYAGIQGQINHLFKTLVITLCAGLLALYLLLLPIIRRTARTLSGQNAKLEEQAASLQGLLEREQETVSELRELNRLKDDFVAVASHEVRTPLTSIIGYAKTLRRPEFAEDRAARDEFLAAIERQGDRLHRLVGNLLAASHLEEGQADPAVATTSLRAVTEEVLAGLGPRAHRVRVFLPHDLPDVVTDRNGLELILANLVDNALKFSPEESPVDLGARQVGTDVELWVSDRGIGIDDDHLHRIFDRFYQVDSSVTRHYGGVGLGLHLVHELAQSLGGTVGVLSAPGSGSTFTLTLSLKPPGDGNEPNPAVEAEQVAAKS